MAKNIICDSKKIDDYLLEIAENPKGKLESFFKQLDNNEYQIKYLSKQKGRENYLRLYALKVDENCFIITGGAIKLTLKMEERKHTQFELNKLDLCRQFLKDKGIFDADGFYEFIKEEGL